MQLKAQVVIDLLRKEGYSLNEISKFIIEKNDLRDKLAAAAVTGVLAGRRAYITPEHAAKQAWSIAHEMMKQRNEV